MTPYSARGKTVEQILEDFERGELNADYGGNTTEYLQAALTVSAAETQALAARRQDEIAAGMRKATWLAAGAAVTGALASIAAVVVAVAR